MAAVHVLQSFFVHISQPEIAYKKLDMFILFTFSLHDYRFLLNLKHLLKRSEVGNEMIFANLQPLCRSRTCLIVKGLHSAAGPP